MSIIALCAPSALVTAVAVSAGGTTAANLLTREPREAWVAAAGTVALLIDFGRMQPWDTAFLGFTTAAPGTSWTMHAGPSEAGLVPLFVDRPIVEPVVPAGETGRMVRSVHLFTRLAGLRTDRFVRIAVRQPDGAAPFRAGILIVNAGFSPRWPQELGGGRVPIDTGSRERLRGGGFGIAEGLVKDGFQWTFGDLDPAEVDTLYAIAKGRGETRPLLLAEDPDETPGLQERLHYGVFDRLERYERIAPGHRRWALTIEDWI